MVDKNQTAHITNEEAEEHSDNEHSIADALLNLNASIKKFDHPTSLEDFERRPSLNYDAANLGQTPKVPHWNGPSVGALSQNAQQRIQQVISAARSVYGNNDVMVRLTVSQALLESGAGLNSGLAANANNFFGIKGQGSAGTTVMSTHEVVNGKTVTINAGFARNATPEDSFLQHQQLLQRPRYQGVLAAAGQGDFALAAHAIQGSGYATDPGYASKLIAINDSIVTPLMSITPNITGAHQPTVAAHLPYGQLTQENAASLTQGQKLAASGGVKQMLGKIAHLFDFS